MRRMIPSSILLALLGASLAGTGCAPYKLKPPDGFAEVDKDDSGTRMKAGDDVGLNLRVFDNVRGGTLAFWGGDLVKKLGRRGYTLVGQSPARSKNGVAGTRFDFTYTPPGTDSKKFYSTALFASDDNVVVVQLAGDEDKRSGYVSRLDEIAKATVVRGCKVTTKICSGPQPGKLTSPPPDPVLGLDTAIAGTATDGGS